MTNYQKDFDSWNIKKKKINKEDTYLPFYHKREIRWCRIGLNIGFEQDGTGVEFSRPVLILKGFSRNVCLVVPLTTSTKKNKYHISIGDIDGKEASVILSQIRLIDTRRLDQHIEFLNKDKFEIIRKAIKDLI
jgi:mRNA interferase MazF